MSNFEVSIATVGAPYGYADYIAEDEKFSPMQMVTGEDVTGKRVGLGVVLMGPIDVPYFEDGAGSSFAQTPLDITNPEEWRQTFRCYLVFNLSSQEYVLCNYRMIRLFDEKNPHNGYISFDTATSRMRVINGLMELAKAPKPAKE